MKIWSSRFLSLRYFICRILVLFLNCFPQFFILNGFIVVLPAGVFPSSLASFSGSSDTLFNLLYISNEAETTSISQKGFGLLVRFRQRRIRYQFFLRRRKTNQ